MKSGDDGWHELMRSYDQDPEDPAEITVKLFDVLQEYIRSMEAIADGSWHLECEERELAPPDSPIWNHIKMCKALLADIKETEVTGTLFGLIPLRRK